jgi:hypothetical protein
MSIRCLTHLYTPLGLLADADGDGLPDGLAVRFVTGRSPGAIDVAARLGLESAGYTPGFTGAGTAGAGVGSDQAVPVWFGPENPACPIPPYAVPSNTGLVALAADGLVVTGSTAEAGWDAARWLAATFPYAAPGGPLLSDLAGGKPVWSVLIRNGAVVEFKLGDHPYEAAPDKPVLAGEPAPAPYAAEAPGDLPPAGAGQLFTVAGLMGSSDTVRHDRAGWQVAVTPETTAEEIAGLCELAARTGVEALGLSFPVAVGLGGAGEAPAAGRPEVRLAGEAPADPVWVETLTAGPAAGAGAAWTAHPAGEPAGVLTVFGAAAADRAAVLRWAAGEAGLVDGLHATLFTRHAGLPEAQAPEGDVVFDLALEQEWEVDRFRREWRAMALPGLTAAGGQVAVDLRLSEPLAVRELLAEEIARDLAALGVAEARIRVLSAYKQGFHWLEEEMLPRLREAGPLSRVAVHCARFTPAAPAAAGGEQAADALELPVRWLQELYPADELLSAALGGIPVAFDLTGPDQAQIYQLTAYAPDGTVALTEGFSPVCSVRPYLPDFPERGRVHPPTGLLRVEQGGQAVVETAIDTDAEAFWTAYQEQVLPRVRDYLTEAYGAQPDPAEQPFFGRLMIELAMSEDDRRLGIREEQISPLDAMHEDLYFGTLDYLNQLGLSLTGKGYPAPGAVEPWVVHTREAGGPTARVRLFARPADQSATADRLPGTAGVLPEAASGIPLDEVIGPDQLPPYLAYLAAIPGIRVWQTGRSHGGRALWAMSLSAPAAGRIAPPQKLSAWRPTLLIQARHHANEVSSTNSILAFAEEAARTGLASRVNLFFSPMANADGAAIHYAMQQAHPNWKLHAARFNAAGVDFGISDLYQREPRFGEARVLPTLWRAVQPDVILDDHGYPSHEWVQPFAGYNSPPYFGISWWMPNALIYGIHYCLDPERFPANHAVQEALRSALVKRFAADPEIAGYTRTLLDRYYNYGQRHVPEKFPLELQEGMVARTAKVNAGPEARKFSGRFPHITAAELVTEVPDETAQGDYLALCARAHLEGDRAVYETLARKPQPVVRRRWTEGGLTWWAVGRERPVSVLD